MSSAIFLSDDLILLFAVGDAAPGPSRWSRAVGGLWSCFGGLPVLSFPRMDLWLGRERVTQRRVMLLQGAVHQHVHVVETQSVKPSEKPTLPQTKKGPIFLRSHPLLLYSTLLGFVGAFGTILVSWRRELLEAICLIVGTFCWIVGPALRDSQKNCHPLPEHSISENTKRFSPHAKFPQFLCGWLFESCTVQSLSLCFYWLFRCY